MSESTELEGYTDDSIEAIDSETITIKGDLSQDFGIVESGNTLMSLGVDKENYSLKYDQQVPIRKIVVSNPIKKSRSMTIHGLTKSIGDLGVVEPIHLMRLESADAETVDEDDDAPEYTLLHGTRRVYGAVRNGLDTIPAIVWDFKDKDKGREASLILGLTLHRAQRRSWSEIWDLMSILEMQSQIKPATFEALFQLESGDAMKLKDVMFSEYTEIKDELFADQKTLAQCYTQLQKLRKDENRLEIEDRTGFSDTTEEAKEIVDSEETEQTLLSEEQVSEILELSDSFGKDVGSDDFGEMGDMFNTPVVQDVKNRKPVDPVVKQQTFARDEYSCKCCGIHGRAFLSTLIYHHVIPVHAGGPDSVENGLTLCDSCHIMLHVIERDGRLPLTEKEFEEYDYEDKLRIKNILFYAKKAILAGKMKGLSDEERKKFARSGMRHRMPGEGHKENKVGYEAYQKTLESLDSVES